MLGILEIPDGRIAEMIYRVAWAKSSLALLADHTIKLDVAVRDFLAEGRVWCDACGVMSKFIGIVEAKNILVDGGSSICFGGLTPDQQIEMLGQLYDELVEKKDA